MDAQDKVFDLSPPPWFVRAMPTERTLHEKTVEIGKPE
jgi:hypothetical protein